MFRSILRLAAPTSHSQSLDGGAAQKVQVGLPLKVPHLYELPDLLVASEVQVQVLDAGELTQAAHLCRVQPSPELKVTHGCQVCALKAIKVYLVRLNNTKFACTEGLSPNAPATHLFI